MVPTRKSEESRLPVHAGQRAHVPGLDQDVAGPGRGRGRRRPDHPRSGPAAVAGCARRRLVVAHSAAAMAIAAHYRWADNERAMRLGRSLRPNSVTLVLVLRTRRRVAVTVIGAAVAGTGAGDHADGANDSTTRTTRSSTPVCRPSGPAGVEPDRAGVDRHRPAHAASVPPPDQPGHRYAGLRHDRVRSPHLVVRRPPLPRVAVASVRAGRSITAMLNGRWFALLCLIPAALGLWAVLS